MRKFLTVSVCLFASLMANAKVVVTPSPKDRTEPDVITISGPAYSDGSYISDQDIENAKKMLTVSYVKVVTDGIALSEDDWKKIINSDLDKNQILGEIANIDISDTQTKGNVYPDDLKYAFSNHTVETITLSRYTNIPEGFFNVGEQNISTINIPDKKKGESTTISIGNSAFNGMLGLTKLNIGSSVSTLGTYMCAGCNNLTSVIFNTPEVKVLPESAFENCTSMKLIDLPQNLETIGIKAFNYCSLETISFPNTLKSIEDNAFNECKLMYVVIPEKVEVIKQGAFKNNQNLTDVYVLGADVKCEESAFLKTQICVNYNFTYLKDKDGNEIKDAGTEGNPATRENWVTCSSLEGYPINPVVLHIAGNVQARKKYENPYYLMLNTPNILNRLKECNDDATRQQFMEEFHLHKEFPWSLQDYAKNGGNCPFVYYSYVDKNGETKKNKMWKAEYGYYSDDNKEHIAALGDYVGWMQFLLVQDDAENDVFDDIKRVDDRWYSMCFPFDLTANQIRTAYGAGTEVCEFIGAWDYGINANKEQIINFRFKPLLSQKDNEELNKEEDENNDSRAVSPIITRANKAYMIHPASKKEGDNTNVWHRIIPGIPAKEQIGDQSKIIETVPEEHEFEIMEKMGIKDHKMIHGYKFLGNYDGSIFLPGNSYYFAYKDEGDTRTLILNNLTEESTTFKWTPMTALVKYTGSSTAAKCFSAFSFSSEIEKGATTGIEEININRMPNTAAKFSQKIYNMNGQVVKEGTSLEGLSKGIYIMNGKKYIVK